MVLWKFALLRRRILIFSPPPIGCGLLQGCVGPGGITHAQARVTLRWGLDIELGRERCVPFVFAIYYKSTLI